MFIHQYLDVFQNPMHRGEMSIAVQNWPRPNRDAKIKKQTRRGDKNRKPTAPLPRWLLEKYCEFYHSDCLGLELLLLIDKIRRVS